MMMTKKKKKKKWRIGLPGIVEGSNFVDETGDGISYIVKWFTKILLR